MILFLQYSCTDLIFFYGRIWPGTCYMHRVTSQITVVEVGTLTWHHSVGLALQYEYEYELVPLASGRSVCRVLCQTACRQHIPAQAAARPTHGLTGTSKSAEGVLDLAN